jgi:prepilin-type N-terminal cleavage/methylation domain-containing protein
MMTTWINQSANHRRARGMTLVELMIVVSMLAILAAVVVPMFGTTSDVARTEAMASNAKSIKGLVIHHAGMRDVPLSVQGYPQSIDGTWFKMGHLPDHSWTNTPIDVEVVSVATNEVYPAVKTFDPKVAGAKSAWYNTANGRFVVRIPAQSSPAATLQLFNDVNKSGATALNQTTE